MLTRYLAALDLRRSLLWCAFLWYLVMAMYYAGHDPALWLHSVGIAAIVGVVLTLNAMPPGVRVRALGFWPVFRFFLIPFCVASFSAFAKGRAFFLIFPLNPQQDIVACSVLAVFGGLVMIARQLAHSRQS